MKEYIEMKKAGVNLPKSYTSFYNNRMRKTDKWEYWKEDAGYKNKEKNVKKQTYQDFYNYLKSGKVKDYINEDKQKRHLEKWAEGTDSYIKCDMETIKEIYKKYRGKGIPVKRGNVYTEYILIDKRISVDRNEMGQTRKESFYLQIHYSNTGSHIVPTKNVWRLTINCQEKK